MKALLLATLYAALRQYVGAGLFDRIAGQVRRLASSELSGQQRMQVVIDFAARDLAVLSETLVRAVVEVVLLKLKA
jgi:hypothetical protein